MSKIVYSIVGLIFFFAVSEYLNNQQLFALYKSQLVNIHSEIKIGAIEVDKIKSQKNSLSIEIEKLNQQIEKEKEILKDLQNKQKLAKVSVSKTISGNDTEKSELNNPAISEEKCENSSCGQNLINKKHYESSNKIVKPEESINYKDNIVKEYSATKDYVSYNSK